MNPSDDITSDDFLSALAAADVLEKFRALPEEARHEFEEWIAKARDEAAHWRRIDLLVMAIRSAPRLGAAVNAESTTAGERRS